MGLLTKQASLRDRRSVLVRLSPKGEDAVRAVNPLQRRVNDLLFADVSRDDFGIVSRFLERFALNSEYALAEIRRSEQRAVEKAARRTGLTLRHRPCHPARASITLPRQCRGRDVGIRTLGEALSRRRTIISARQPNAFLKRKAALLKAGPEGAVDRRRRGPQRRLHRRMQGLDVTGIRFLAEGAGKGAGARQGARRQHPHRAGRPRHVAVAGGRVRRGGRDLLPVLPAAAPRARCSTA